MVLLWVSSIAMAGPRPRKLPQVPLQRLERALQALAALAKVLPGEIKRWWRDRQRGGMKRWCHCRWVLHLPGLMLASIMGWISSGQLDLLKSLLGLRKAPEEPLRTSEGS